MAKMILANKRLCLACNTCVLECAMAHARELELAEALRSSCPPRPRVHVEPLAGGYGMPIQCSHCQDAPCLAICPTGAIHRRVEGGPVLLEAARCTGCRFCMLACPFGVITLSRDGRAAIKCDLCAERLEQGLEPACVAGCPTGALEFREIDDWLAERRRRIVQTLAEQPEAEAEKR